MNCGSEMSSHVSSPEVASESRGSSVSTGMIEEYEDLLKYAVVTPVVGLAGQAKVALNHLRPRSPSPLTTSGLHQPQVSSDNNGPRNIQDVVANLHSTFTAMSAAQDQIDKSISHQSVPQHSASGESYYLDDVLTARSRDPEIMRLDTQWEAWCSDLKRNVLAEFEQSRLRLLERSDTELNRERQQHSLELAMLKTQFEQQKELLATYETSIARKDHVIANLSSALQKYKDRVELQHSFSSWKLCHCHEKRETFTRALADKHYNKKVQGRIWYAWFGILKTKWKQRMDKACQSKAEEVCIQLSGEYEQQLETAQRSLEESQAEVQRLKAQRDLYEENMKKAFMRGVCALNVEAMSMFRQSDVDDGSHSNQDSYPGYTEDCRGNSTTEVDVPEKEISQKKNLPHTCITTSASHSTCKSSGLEPVQVRQKRESRRILPRFKPEVVIQKH